MQSNGLKIVSINIGNIGIKLYMNAFTHIGTKTGSSTHSHGLFEYHFVMKGDALIKIGDKKVSLSENSSILIYPDTFHNFIKNGCDADVLSLSFSLKKNRNGTDYYKSIQNKLLCSDYLVIAESSLLKDLILSIVSNIYSEKLFAFEEMRSLLVLFFTNIFSKITETKDIDKNQINIPEYDMRTFIIEDYFNERYMDNITLTELSNRLHLSNQQTDRIIKQMYGVGFRQRLTKIRIKSALELLCETNKSLLEISENVGYQSYNGFYSAFKKETGKAPEEWRKEN